MADINCSPSQLDAVVSVSAARADPDIVLNVQATDFIKAMNRIVTLVKARRRRLLETHGVSHHGAHSPASRPATPRAAGTSPSASQKSKSGPGTPNRSRTPTQTATSAASGHQNTNGVSQQRTGIGASPSPPAATSPSKLRRLSTSSSSGAQKDITRAATPQYTADAEAQIAEIRGRHSAPAASTAVAGHQGNTATAFPHRSPHAPVLVALGGTAGSGKTTAVRSIVQYLENIQRAPWVAQALLASQAKAPSGGTSTPQHEQAPQILQASSPIRAIAVPLDGYHRYRTELDEMERIETGRKALAYARRGAPFTFNPVLYERDLLELLDSGKCKFPSFEHHVKDPKEETIVVDGHPRHHCSAVSAATPAEAQAPSQGVSSSVAACPPQFDFGVEVLIVEGIYALFSGEEQIPEDGTLNPNYASPSAPLPVVPLTPKELLSWKRASQLFDLKLYIECDVDTSTDRLTRRHMAAWGIPKEEAFVRASGSDYDNGLIVERTKANADVVLGSVQLQGL